MGKKKIALNEKLITQAQKTVESVGGVFEWYVVDHYCLNQATYINKYTHRSFSVDDNGPLGGKWKKKLINDVNECREKFSPEFLSLQKELEQVKQNTHCSIFDYVAKVDENGKLIIHSGNNGFNIVINEGIDWKESVTEELVNRRTTLRNNWIEQVNNSAKNENIADWYSTSLENVGGAIDNLSTGKHITISEEQMLSGEWKDEFLHDVRSMKKSVTKQWERVLKEVVEAVPEANRSWYEIDANPDHVIFTNRLTGWNKTLPSNNSDKEGIKNELIHNAEKCASSLTDIWSDCLRSILKQVSDADERWYTLCDISKTGATAINLVSGEQILNYTCDPHNEKWVKTIKQDAIETAAWFKENKYPVYDEKMLAVIKEKLDEALANSEFPPNVVSYDIVPANFDTSVCITLKTDKKSICEYLPIDVNKSGAKAGVGEATAIKKKIQKANRVLKPAALTKIAGKCHDYIVRTVKKDFADVEELHKFVGDWTYDTISHIVEVSNDKDAFVENAEACCYGEKAIISFNEVSVSYDTNEKKCTGFSGTSENAVSRLAAIFEYKKQFKKVIKILDDGTLGHNWIVRLTSWHFNEMTLMIEGDDDRYPQMTIDLAAPEYEKEVKAFKKQVKSADAAIISEKQARLDNVSNIAGTILCDAVLSVLDANGAITENTIVKLLRGLSTGYHKQYTYTAYCRIFNQVNDGQIRSIVRALINNGFLMERMFYGDYGEYFPIYATSTLPEFRTLHTQAKESTDSEFSHIKEYSAHDETSDASLLAYILEHPVIVWYSKNVRDWLGGLGDKYVKYLELRIKLENDKTAKKTLREILKIVKGKDDTEAKTKKEPPAPTWEVVEAKEYGEYDVRFVIRDIASKAILDDAQGYGYKTKDKAIAAWVYKQNHKR